MVRAKQPLVDPLDAFCKDTEAYLAGPFVTLVQPSTQPPAVVRATITEPEHLFRTPQPFSSKHLKGLLVHVALNCTEHR